MPTLALPTDERQSGGAVGRWGIATVSGKSMHPTLREGDRLLVAYGRHVQAGDLVLVQLPGERPLAVKRAIRPEPGGWFVERDNPRAGVDSWSLGPIESDAVVGVVIARLAPRPALFAATRRKHVKP